MLQFDKPPSEGINNRSLKFRVSQSLDQEAKSKGAKPGRVLKRIQV